MVQQSSWATAAHSDSASGWKYLPDKRNNFHIKFLFVYLLCYCCSYVVQQPNSLHYQRLNVFWKQYFYLIKLINHIEHLPARQKCSRKTADCFFSSSIVLYRAKPILCPISASETCFPYFQKTPAWLRLCFGRSGCWRCKQGWDNRRAGRHILVWSSFLEKTSSSCGYTQCHQGLLHQFY